MTLGGGMLRSDEQLLDDALQIWRAGLAAVDAGRLVHDHLRCDGMWLHAGDEPPLDLRRVRRIAVVGAGKAGAGMAAAVEDILQPVCNAAGIELTGWINVPADCVRSLQRVALHAARPAGVNEPTEAGIVGTEEILRLVSELTPDDLCIALISGGGSALLPAPVEGISLADKVAVTRFLSEAGANIAELNTVRKRSSRIKGGGLARACRAGKLLALIISDVPGDPLDIIASGPTVLDSSTNADALAVLARFDPNRTCVPASVYQVLGAGSLTEEFSVTSTPQVTNLIIGNNATAVDAAGMEAERLGYSHAMIAATKPEGPVEEIGRHLAQMALTMREGDGPDCLISGGEGTVQLIDAADRGLGGRNQQLALAALIELAKHDPRGIAIVSAGTDGEDGPTDAAGAIFDAATIAAATRLSLDAADYLRRNDAYRFFAPLGGLLITGPTHTNVCDLRVITVNKSRA
jgi:glycerate 2-kinase